MSIYNLRAQPEPAAAASKFDFLLSPEENENKASRGQKSKQLILYCSQQSAKLLCPQQFLPENVSQDMNSKCQVAACLETGGSQSVFAT